jgi:hypothetical protein
MLHLKEVPYMKHKKRRLDAKLLCIALLFLVGSQAFAIIRSPYPARTFPPYRGRTIVIGDDSTPPRR